MSAAATTSLHRRQFRSADPTRRMIGWIVVFLVHVVVLWALITGTARKGLEIIKKPLEAAVIEEVIIPPPPPPPPKIIKPPEPQAPKVEAPPPPFVPPPEVTPPVSNAPSIVSAPTPPLTAPVIAPPAPPAAPVGRAEIGVVCPNQVKPEMPVKAVRDHIEGVVKAQATIRDGAVVSVQILSGPSVFRTPVTNAMMQYKCVTSGGEVTAVQEFNFRVE
jgi:periplasmic protein TonB